MSRTLRTSITVQGVGLHTGAPARTTLQPRECPGISFRRSDLPDVSPVPATLSSLGRATRHTVLRNDRASVATVEHLLAACWGMDITALDVEVHGPELPIGDGSALVWIEAFDQAGYSPVHGEGPPLVPGAATVREGERSIALAPAPVWSVHFAGIFPDGKQHEAVWTPQTDFASELAAARTFCRLSELVSLRRSDLAQGGNAGNSLVWMDRPVTEELREELGKWWPGVRLVSNSDGLLGSQRLRWPDECARHKLLDLLGDLALLRPFGPCRVEAVQSGHALAHELVRRCASLQKGVNTTTHSGDTHG